MLGGAMVDSSLLFHKFTLVSEKMEPCLRQDWQGALDESGDISQGPMFPSPSVCQPHRKVIEVAGLKAVPSCLEKASTQFSPTSAFLSGLCP